MSGALRLALGLGVLLGAGGAWLALSPDAPAPGGGAQPPGAAATAAGAEVVLGEGLTARLHDVTLEDHAAIGERWMVLRFLLPGLGGAGRDYAALEPRLAELCTRLGVPLVALIGPVDQVMVQLIDRPFPRGVATPEATAYAAAFRIEGEGCAWTD